MGSNDVGKHKCIKHIQRIGKRKCWAFLEHSTVQMIKNWHRLSCTTCSKMLLLEQGVGPDDPIMVPTNFIHYDILWLCPKPQDTVCSISSRPVRSTKKDLLILNWKQALVLTRTEIIIWLTWIPSFSLGFAVRSSMAHFIVICDSHNTLSCWRSPLKQLLLMNHPLLCHLWRTEGTKFDCISPAVNTKTEQAIPGPTRDNTSAKQEHALAITIEVTSSLEA